MEQQPSTAQQAQRLSFSKSSKHTPGPWKFVASTGVLKSETTIIASAEDDEIGPHIVIENKADAKLIEAAPDLLEALNELLMTVPWGSLPVDLVSKCQLAIRKTEVSN